MRLLAIWLSAAAVSVPLVNVLLHLFVPAGDIWRHLARTVLWDYLLNSAWLVLGTMLLSLVAGVGCAWLVATCRFPGHRWLRWLLLAPMALPAYVVAYAYADLLQFAGPVQGALRDLTGWGARDYWFPEIRSLGGAIVVMAAVFFPYVYIFTVLAFAAQAQRSYEVSRSLGRGVWYCFWRVSVPLARPAIVGGLALVAMETLADFGTVQHFGVTTFTTGIYRTWFALGAPQAATRLAAWLLVVVALALVAESALRGRGRITQRPGAALASPFIALHGWRGWLALAAGLLPVLVGFIVPLIALARLTLHAGEGASSLPLLLPALWDTLKLAALGALATVSVGLLLVLAVRRRPAGWAGRMQGLGYRLATLGYAVPGTVLAVGVLTPFGAFDRWVDGVVEQLSGYNPGLILSGTVLILVYAYVLRFLTVATKAIEPGLARLPQQVSEAARMLGAGPVSRLFRIYLPALRPSLLSALVLVMVETVKELPATLVLRPFDIETLALLAYRYAADERLAGAALPSLMIALVGLIPVWLLGRGLFAGQQDIATKRETAG